MSPADPGSGQIAAALPARTPELTAAVLVEALPYIRRFMGKVVVVKYGGNALAGWADGTLDGHGVAPGAAARNPDASSPSPTDPALASFAQDVVLLRSVGMLPVVVHGGGPQIGDMMRRLGKETEFREGLRVTDAETLDIARMVLVGKVNRDIVAAINVHGALAVGLSGEDANLITATPRAANLGFVGDVLSVDRSIIERLVAQGLIPVVATIGTDEAGQSYNINADSAAGALAAALGAEKLIFLTDVEGLRADPEDPGSLLHRVSASELEELIRSGAAAGGMVPKARALVDALRGGVAGGHVLDGRVPHALLLELFTDVGVGTMVQP